MHYWLLKSEPSTYSWADLCSLGKDMWDGVRNYQARNHMKDMAPKDEAFFYHSGKEKAIVGTCRITRAHYPDPTATDDKGWVVVDVVPLGTFLRPITLAELRKEKALADMVLLHNSRLSVQPVQQAEYAHICQLAKGYTSPISIPMRRKLLFDAHCLSITLRRLCAELIERHKDFSSSILLGLQPKGVFLASRLHSLLAAMGHDLPIGALDATFHRDDFSSAKKLIQARTTQIKHSLEGKSVVLIDDVLYTGRTTRAALDALLAYGRPYEVELLVLVDRCMCRELPIQATYVGRRVNTQKNQRILLELTEQNKKVDGIWIVENKNTSETS